MCLAPFRPSFASENSFAPTSEDDEEYPVLGTEPAEAAVLRLLATLYDTRRDLISARRCLERVVSLDQRYGLSELSTDSDHLATLKRSS